MFDKMKAENAALREFKKTIAAIVAGDPDIYPHSIVAMKAALAGEEGAGR
jgi:hypothetical protein